MKTIYKYQLKPLLTQHIKMPSGAKILTVQEQFNSPVMWALVDTSKQLETRTFIILGTGHEINEPAYTLGDYIGTYQLNEGKLVYHLFEQAK